MTGHMLRMHWACVQCRRLTVYPVMTGYTAKVGLRKPPKPLTLAECMAIAQEYLSRPPIIRLDDALLSGGYVEGPATPVPTRDPHWLRDQIYRAAAALDGLPPEMRETLAHRTRLRDEQVDGTR